MENWLSTMAPLLLRNMVTSIFIHTHKSIQLFSRKHSLLQTPLSFLVSFFLFFLTLLPSFFSSLSTHRRESDPLSAGKTDLYTAPSAPSTTESGVSRALSQLLLIMSDVPVSSRKYEVVRSLAENLIDDNLSEGNRILTEVNCAVLSAAFVRSLRQVEASASADNRRKNCNDGGGDTADDFFVCNNRAGRLMKGLGYYGRAALRYAKSRGEVSRSGISAEKLAVELLWLARKMAACGCAEEAVCGWASASNLAWLALSAETRLQGSLVKVTAFLIKQAKEMGRETHHRENSENQTISSNLSKSNHIRQTKMKLLMTWLPLLCCASNGTDIPVLSRGERAELEVTLEEIISSLDKDEEQEWVLSIWLNHFTRCPASDWPNLCQCYTRWYGASRSRLVQAGALVD